MYIFKYNLCNKLIWSEICCSPCSNIKDLMGRGASFATLRARETWEFTHHLSVTPIFSGRPLEGRTGRYLRIISLFIFWTTLRGSKVMYSASGQRIRKEGTSAVLWLATLLPWTIRRLPPSRVLVHSSDPWNGYPFFYRNILVLVTSILLYFSLQDTQL